MQCHLCNQHPCVSAIPLAATDASGSVGLRVLPQDHTRLLLFQLAQGWFKRKEGRWEGGTGRAVGMPPWGGWQGRGAAIRSDSGLMASLHLRLLLSRHRSEEPTGEAGASPGARLEHALTPGRLQSAI